MTEVAPRKGRDMSTHMKHTDDPNSQISRDVLSVLDTCHYSLQSLQDRLNCKYSKGEINSALQAMKNAGMVEAISPLIWGKSPMQLRVAELEAEVENLASLNNMRADLIASINNNTSHWKTATCGQAQFAMQITHRVTTLKTPDA